MLVNCIKKQKFSLYKTDSRGTPVDIDNSVDI